MSSLELKIPITTPEIPIPHTQQYIHHNKLNLRKIKYDIQTLEENVDNIHMKTCVNTQILTAEFCVKYVLNEDYMSCIEDTYCISYGYVLQRQPHLTKEDIFREYAKINNGKGYSHGI